MAKLPITILSIILLSTIPLALAQDDAYETGKSYGQLGLPYKDVIHEDAIVLLETGSGNLTIEFFPNDAPNHVDSFLKFADGTIGINTNYYTDTVFHRIISDFMIQGGDKNSKYKPDDTSTWGRGNPGFYINAEFNDIKHNRGIVSMARSPDPNSAGSQFFIVHKDSTFLDGQYTVFGRLVTQESFETLDKIAALKTDQNDIPINRDAAKITSSQILTRSDFDNLLNLDPPERTSDFVKLTDEDGKYTNDELNFIFLPPIGWAVQTPPQVNSNSPIIAVVGSVIDDMPPAFTVQVKKSSLSLDEEIYNLKESIQPGITSGFVEIKNEFTLDHKGFDTYFLEVSQDNKDKFEEPDPLRIDVYLIKSSDKIYVLQFSNLEKNFDMTQQQFNDILDSFTITESSSSNSLQTQISDTKIESQPSEGGGCLIATATYGSEMAPQVQFLREIRDNTVLQTQSGTSFMTVFNSFYYTFSPAVADYERENPVFKEAVKVGLTPLLTSLTILNYVEIDTEQEMLGYGIGIIMLNIGMYFVAPTIAIISLKKRFF